MPSQVASVQSAPVQSVTTPEVQSTQQAQTSRVSTIQSSVDELQKSMDLLRNIDTSDPNFVRIPSTAPEALLGAVCRTPFGELPDNALLIDSKEDVNVCPLSFASEYPLLPISENILLKTVSGHRVRVHGLRIVFLEVLPNKYMWVCFVVADVTFPILSVCKLTDMCSEISFRRDGGSLQMKDKFKIDIQKDGNEFYIKVFRIINFHDSFEYMFHAEFVN